jgi:hypothetical protein
LELELKAELVEVGPALEPSTLEPAVTVIELDAPLARREPRERAAQPIEPAALDRAARQINGRVTGGELPGAGAAVVEGERHGGARTRATMSYTQETASLPVSERVDAARAVGPHCCSNAKILLQSFFMLMTVQPFFFASS